MQAKKVKYLALLLVCTVLISRAEQSSPVRVPAVSSQSAATVSDYGNFPFIFEANEGQADSQIKFLSHGGNYSIYLTPNGMRLAVHPPGPTTSAASFNPSGRNRTHASPIRQLEKAVRNRRSTILGIDLVGASPTPKILGEDPLRTKVNYFIGRDPKRWRRNVPTYGKVRYLNVYPGIDLIYYGNNHKIEYDFELAPGADPTKIQFSVTGADNMSVDSQGNLVLSKDRDVIQFQMPLIYQEIQGSQTRVPGTYVLHDSTHVGFAVGKYDNTRALVIDPVLVYSTFLGGSSDSFGFGIAVNSTGHAFVTGITDSPDFPLASMGSYNPSQFRMFLSELDPTGSSLLFADYFGGTTGSDDPYAIALDSAGNVYITGCTASADFPLVNPYQATFSGSQDAFLTKFSADGSSIVYSTYLGGSNLIYIGGTTSQIGTSVAVDDAGEAVVAGFTMATDFPTLSAYQSSVSADQFGNWGEYGFVTKFAPDGASLLYSTYLAGSTYNVASCNGCFPISLILGVATDGAGNAYLTGWTDTSNFPVTNGALMTTSPANPLSDVGFVSKFSNSGALVYSTYLGGLDGNLDAIAVDGTGSAYVTGFATGGDGFPTTNTGICDPTTAACNGTVVAKLDPKGASLVYSTFLGTSNNMTGQAIQVDSGGDAFVVGSDQQFDLTNPIEQYAGNGDVVIAEIDPSGNTLLMATFLGGQGLETSADSLAIDNNGAVYVTGSTQSSDFPVTQSGFQTLLIGQNEVFVAKIDSAGSGPAVSIAPPSLQFPSQNVDSTSTPQTSILRNMSSNQLTINNKTISGDFAETDDCGGTIPPASLCTFTVTFTPTASGGRSGTLLITDNTSAGSHSIALTGQGAAAAAPVSISPTALNFPPSSVGTTSTAQVVTFTNNGGAAVVVSEIQVAGAFAKAGSNCGTVAPYASCTVQVSFLPTSAGVLDGTLQFLDSTSASPQVVTLSGSGTDFVTSAPTSSATVAPGGIASYQLNVSPMGGSFSGTIRMVCTGAPAFAACQVTPSSITPGSSPATASVTVTTSTSVAQTGGGMANGKSVSTSIFMSLAVFGGLLISVNDRRKWRIYFAVGTMTMMVLLVACGRTPRPSVSTTTPAGTYTLTVAATSGSIQHLTKLTLVVQ